MQQTTQVTFGQFRLDSTNQCLWRGKEAIPLRPKAFAVLHLLVAHSGQLVTKQQLLDAVWPSTFVTDAVLKDAVKQLREAMGDVAASPQYIETSHRRGYRFIAKIDDGASAGGGSDTASPGSAAALAAPAVDAGSSGTPATATAVLGRDGELAKLRECLGRALKGDRQVVFVTGEPGIGKTTLVDGLLRQASSLGGMRIARGQCLEQYGAGEAYLPVLEALSRLGRGPGGEDVIRALRQHAPAWLLELPSLLLPGDRQMLREQVPGGTRERMLREMADAIEALTATTPLILLLEDLHWSDHSTVDLVGYLARRRDPARLMVIGTYRPVDVILGDHPLKAIKRELLAHGLARELPLEYLTEETIAEYVGVKFPGHQLPKSLVQLIHRRTEGNPLFMVNLVEYLIDERVIIPVGDGFQADTFQHGKWQLRGGLAEIESGIPDGIRQLIEKQIDRVTADERRVLEGASVVGMECSSVAIGAGLETPIDWIEEQCEALVRKYQFLAPARLVELPDGTITPRYKFNHMLYLEVLYGLVPPMRRAQIHRRIGECGEAIYQDHVDMIAAELAMHFEQGGDYRRAVKYLLQAAANATHRSAHYEAERLAQRGLHSLQKLSRTAERDQQEVSLRMILEIAETSNEP